MPHSIARFVVKLLAISVSFLCAQTAQAGFVTYTTSGKFGSSSSNVVQIQNGNAAVEITYVGGGETNLLLPETSADFGYFIVKNIDPGSANINISDTFVFTVSQTNPSSQTGMFSSTVEGKIKFGTNREVIVEINSQNPLTLGSIRYLLEDSYTLDSPANQLGATKTTYITADISETGITPTPAPPSLVLALSGIGCTGLFSRLRSRRRAAVQ